MKELQAEHGVVCRLAEERLGYFGWPSVTRLEDGTLAVASSGMRLWHVCPWGKTVLHLSGDEGRTWTPSRVINDSPIDDRDAGILALGGNRLLVTWFSSDTRNFPPMDWLSAEDKETWLAVVQSWDDAMVQRHVGSWIMTSADGGATWSAPWRAPVNTPHGPIRLSSGELLYFGKDWLAHQDTGMIRAVQSADGGRTWRDLGEVPLPEGAVAKNFCEPHVVEVGAGASARVGARGELAGCRVR